MLLLLAICVAVVAAQTCSSFKSCGPCNAGTEPRKKNRKKKNLVDLSFQAAPGRCVWCVGGLLYEPECRDAHVIGNNAAGNSWQDYACNPGYLTNGPEFDRNCASRAAPSFTRLTRARRSPRPLAVLPRQRGRLPPLVGQVRRV